MDRHTLLWELQDQERALMDCEAWKERDAVHVLVKQAGDQDRVHTFPDCTEAVHWAIALERTLVANGWKKRI